MNNALRVGGVAATVLLLAGSAGFEPLYPSAYQDRTDAVPIPPGQSDANDRDDARTPELPRATVEVPPITVTGRTIHVPTGGDLQKAIDEATGGDAITLAPGATYTGPFELRRKDGDGWIVIASAAKDLPAAGTRVEPSDAAKMPRLVADSGHWVIRAAPGAHHYRLVGLEIAPAAGTSLTNLVELGSGDERGVDALPHHVIIDRCYLHGDRQAGTRRGVSLNASRVAVVDSYLSDFKDRTADAQALSGWNGTGPFLIEGNYLEASGENVMFGGGDPAIANLVPSDIVVVRNQLAKPLRWKKDDPAFEGTEWSVKNLFELKNARRVLIDGNLLEHNWPHAQNGFAILFTVRNQDGGAPWSVVEDVTFSNNVIRHVAAGINILGRDDNHPSQQTRRITIRNNVFLDVGGRWGFGRLFQLLESTHGVAIVNNTGFQTGSLLFGGDHPPHTGFVFEGNVVPHNEYGITASGTAPGNDTLQKFFPGAVFQGNVLAGGNATNYPRNNMFPPSLDAISAQPAQGGAHLALPRLTLSGSTGQGGSQSRPPGADIAAVEKALGPLASRVGS